MNQELPGFKTCYEANKKDLKNVGNDLIRQMNTKRRRVITLIFTRCEIGKDEISYLSHTLPKGGFTLVNSKIFLRMYPASQVRGVSGLPSSILFFGVIPHLKFGLSGPPSSILEGHCVNSLRDKRQVKGETESNPYMRSQRKGSLWNSKLFLMTYQASQVKGYGSHSSILEVYS